MNTILLRRIQQDILAHPDNFEMESFFNNEHRPVEHYTIHACGTTACIGGRAMLLSTRKMGINSRKDRSKSVVQILMGLTDGMDSTKYESVADIAAELLQLSFSQSEKLFYITDWPKNFREDYVHALYLRDRAEAACFRIDHFIKTKGQE